MTEVLFALIVVGQEVRAYDGTTLTAAGEQFWVTRDTEGWTAARSSIWYQYAPRDLMVFRTEQAAHDFAATWKGHPWYVVPTPGQHRVVRVQARRWSVIEGYDEIPSGTA